MGNICHSLPITEGRKIFFYTQGLFFFSGKIIFQRRRQGHFILTEISTNKCITIENRAKEICLA